jgi:transcriptional pleiotropic regulator of transition state genes
VLPIEIRKVLDIKQKDAIEIFTDDDKIVLQKYQPSCIFCGNADNIIHCKGKLICKSCIDELASLK